MGCEVDNHFQLAGDAWITADFPGRIGGEPQLKLL
jgi:hypothetical protein